MPIYKTGKRKNGKEQYKIVVSFTDANGKYRQKSKVAYGAAEAKDEERRLRLQITESIPDSKMTVQELYEEYINSKKHEIRATTMQKTQGILNREVLPILKNYSLDKISTKVMQNWKNTLGSKELSAVTKNHALQELRTLFNYAVKIGYLDKNPANNISKFRDPNFTTTQEKIQYYTVEQFQLFIAEAKKEAETLDDYRYYVFFNVAFLTGMRKGENNAFNWTDVDFDRDIIHIRRSVAQKLKGGDIETPPKNKSSYRDIQMPSNLKAILKQQKERQQNLKGFNDEFKVCGGPYCLRDTNIENKNQKYAAAAGLPHIRIHDFRHSHASLLCNEGINIQEIARRLGHSDISMTWNTYSHLYPREEERAVAILEKV